MLEASNPTSSPEAQAFTLSPLDVKELWVWLQSGLRERQAVLARWSHGAEPSPSRAVVCRLEAERTACRRLVKAFDAALSNRASSQHGTSDWFHDRVERGMDWPGVALLTRFLGHQVNWWRAATTVSECEREGQLTVLAAASERLHARLGADPAQVQRWAPGVSFPPYPDTRAHVWSVMERGDIFRVLYKGEEVQRSTEDAAERAWQLFLARWVAAMKDRPRRRAEPVADARAPQGARNPRWPYALVAATLSHWPEPVPGGQRYPGNPPEYDTAEAEAMERFLAVFPEPAPSVRFHRLHARLSQPPDAGRLAQYVRWLEVESAGGAALRELPQGRRWPIARMWHLLDDATGDVRALLTPASTVPTP